LRRDAAPRGARRQLGESKMPWLDTKEVILAGIALFAAFVNGAIG
jgi:hypothetical protein